MKIQTYNDWFDWNGTIEEWYLKMGYKLTRDNELFKRYDHVKDQTKYIEIDKVNEKITCSYLRPVPNVLDMNEATRMQGTNEKQAELLGFKYP